MKSISYLEVVEKCYLTPPEFAQKYGMPTRTVYWQIKNGNRDFVIFKDRIFVKDEQEARKLAKYDHVPPYP